MKEAFLHYLWNYKLFNQENLCTETHEQLRIVSSGVYTGLDGPDFFNAQVYIGEQLWAGNIEIHLNASDWYIHGHEKDLRYDNVILHVVWENDTPVYRSCGSEVPTLVLKDIVSKEVLANYEYLMLPKSYLYCEDRLGDIDKLTLLQWKENLFFERLSDKVQPIQHLLIDNQLHWEQTFFCFLAKSFGLNANGEAFYNTFRNFPITIIHKQSYSLIQLEALFLGVVGLLDIKDEVQDDYCKELIREWSFLQHKYNLSSTSINTLRFFQLRPPNFPSVRLAQLAAFYYYNGSKVNMLFQQQMSLEEMYSMFDVEISSYWDTHYVINKVSKASKKRITKNFIDLLVINTILPFQFAYAKVMKVDEDISEYLIDTTTRIKAEKNSIVKLFETYKVTVDHAMDSQALIQLKKKYCDQKRCLECMIGKKMMK